MVSWKKQGLEGYLGESSAAQNVRFVQVEQTGLVERGWARGILMQEEEGIQRESCEMTVQLSRFTI